MQQAKASFFLGKEIWSSATAVFLTFPKIYIFILVFETADNT